MSDRSAGAAPLLQVRGLKAYYRTLRGPVRAVDGVDMSVMPGEVFGIAGESGCGKSTLTKAILQLLRAPGYIAGGSMSFEGQDLMGLGMEAMRRLRGSGMSYVPQSSMNALNPVMRIGDQVADAIVAHLSLGRSDARRRCEELLALVGLPRRAGRMYPHELSGGMRQRAVIAISIALGPRLIIADEPTTALDVVTQRGILVALGDIRQKLGAAIMLISHDLAVHAEIVDTLMIMYAGKVAEVGSVLDVFEDPLHPYSQVLVAAIPSIESRREISGLAGQPPNLLTPPAGCRFQPRCPKATSRCATYDPPLREVKPGRFVACVLYEERSP